MTVAELEAPPPRPKWFGAIDLFARLVSTLILAIALVPIGVAVAIFIPGPLSVDTNVVVARGAHTSEIADQLASTHAVFVAPLFTLAARLVGRGSIKAGEYALPAHASVAAIALMMHEGRSVVRLFTIAEGLTSFEIVRLMDADPALAGVVTITPLEGTMLPETYRYSFGDSRAGLIARMQKAMQDKLSDLWSTRDADLPLKSLNEAVTLASIVEKETRKTNERPRIAAVFYNRLRQNMRLQSDPTVIYALTGGKETMNHTLSHDDLSFVSPINTYVSDGLPPQPICNPGSASIEAALHPERNNFLYFVADGTGGHVFASDLATHNQNINHWHQVQEKAATRP